MTFSASSPFVRSTPTPPRRLAHPFLRPAQSVPLAHGAVFSHKPLTAKEWIVEIAFRVHGPPTTGLTETGEDGKVKRLHKGGRGLAFWYTKVSAPPRTAQCAS